MEGICNRIDCCRIIDNICVYYLTKKNQWWLLTEDGEVGFSPKNNVSVHRLCIRALCAREAKNVTILCR